MHSRPYSRAASTHSFRRFPPSPSDDHDVDIDSTPARPLAAGPERTEYQPRRTSALSYQTSGSRDPQDRSYSRSSRNLVVVIPPSDLPLDHGRLGNVLSMGPRHRLSQGILMPLFPSMFGQLNAIAREYNFPSTVGLCLFLHMNQNGTTMTPRISDDSWQYLFGHLFDGRSSSDGRQLPIGGSIEFDIDLNKARWFDSWISGTLRDSDQLLPPVGNSSEAHQRGESRTINLEEQPVEAQSNVSGSHTPVTSSRPETLRHLPKKLSLVDRLELHAVHLPLKSQDPDFSESSPSHGTYASSPILKSAIPRAAENDLEHRINSWRASAELHPVSVAETYQPAPDVGVSASITAMDEYALARNFRQAIDEYLWSATSEGPRTPTAESPITSPLASSIHIDRRANGTVPLTPTTMTSWGPGDHKRHTPVSSVTRLPSPGVGERVIKDILTPRRRAVWGNSFGWRSATTWKQVYPYPPTGTMPNIRVQLPDSDGLVPQYPNLELYPSTESQSPFNTPKGLSSSPRSVWGSSFGWQRSATWRSTYPYSVVQSVGPIQLGGPGRSESKYPNLCIYPAAFPYFEIYPACSVEEDVDVSQPVSVMLDESNKLLAHYPSLVIYPPVYPYLDIYPPVVEGMKTKGPSQVDTNIYLGDVSTLYPNFVIYPPVYPHFDLYPKSLQISETVKQKEVDVKLVNAGCLTAEYPNLTIYPGAYPHLEIYPGQYTRQPSAAVWGLSFGWLTAKTWVQVYPFQTASPLSTKRYVDGQSKFISTSGSERAGTADSVLKKQAIWGNSFGWKNATTWRAVWPTPYTRAYTNVSPISVHLGQQIDSSPNYPYLVIYPSVYPHFDIYPPPAAQPTKEIQLTVGLIPHYPNLLIYPAAYPHFDLYPAFTRASVSVERGKGESNLRCRRIEMWRAKTAAQVGLSELLLNNHIWEVDEPLQLDLADYAWSRTSAGPGTSPLELFDTPSISRSVHIDRRIQGSVLRTPSTATTWGPHDDDRYSDIDSIERVPSPDLGQRVFDDVENVEFFYRPWHMVPSALEQSVFSSGYPHLVIYPPADPHLELYQARRSVLAFENEVTETLANSNVYLAPDRSVYPHFNIYPVVDRQIEIPRKIVPSARHKQPVSLYPNFDILYPTIIPYPCVSAKISQLSGTEQSPISPSIERKPVSVKLPVQYPVLELYPAGYPWSLEFLYPAVSIDGFDDRTVVLEPRYPCIRIYSPVYPFVEPYPGSSKSVQVPGTVDEDEYESAKACLTSVKFKPINPESASYVYPYFDSYPAAPMPVAQQARVEQDAYILTMRRRRRTHRELHDLVFRSLGKQPARISKTHLQLHTEVFQDGVVWTPSGYTQDPSSLITRKQGDVPVPETLQRLHSKGNLTPHPSRSRPGTASIPSSDKFIFPLPPLPPLSPLRIRTPSQPPPSVSETPMLRGSPTSAHVRTRSARLSQAVKAMMPGGHRRHFSETPASPPPEDHKERAKSPKRFLSLVDRRSTAVPPSTSEFLTRSQRNATAKESFVMQRAKAYDQAHAVNQSSAAKGTHSPFVLPPLPSLPPMTGMAEVMEKSKTTFT